MILLRIEDIPRGIGDRAVESRRHRVGRIQAVDQTRKVCIRRRLRCSVLGERECGRGRRPRQRARREKVAKEAPVVGKENGIVGVNQHLRSAAETLVILSEKIGE